MMALSVGRFIAKKQTEAKNLLKLLWKRPYSMEFGEDLERAWLLYADSFIAVKKNKKEHSEIILFLEN